MSLISSEMLPVGGIGVDIGSKLDGDDYTGDMVAVVGPTGKVYSFEPDPDGFKALQDKYGSFPNVILEQKAVTDKDGPVQIVKSGTHYSLLYKGDGLTVDGVSLDSYFKDVPKVDCVKTDTEGGEYRILKGAKELIKKNPQMLLIVEMHEGMLEGDGVTKGVWNALMEELGLEIFVNGAPLQLKPKQNLEAYKDQELRKEISRMIQNEVHEQIQFGVTRVASLISSWFCNSVIRPRVDPSGTFLTQETIDRMVKETLLQLIKKP
jgi:FkbM family methyltransferase